MNVLIGFVFGYVLGAKAGPESIEQIRRAWMEIQESAEFQGLLAAGSSFLEQALKGGGSALGDAIANLVNLGVGKVVEQLSSLAKGTGDGNAVWASVAQSPEFQMLLARGLSLVDGVLAQATAASGGQGSRGFERGM